MLKRMLIGALSALAMTSGALAADLPLRPTLPAFPASAPAFTWTGFYLGANAGYVSSHNRLDGSVPALDAILPGIGTLALETSSEGFTGGGQLGYNYQFGAGSGVVLGLEADFAYTGLDRTVALPIPAALGLQGRFRSHLDELGTIRARLGYAYGRFMLYGTGGFAYGETVREASLTAGGQSLARVTVDDLDVGYAVGGGLEYALLTYGPGAVTLRGEYLHYDLGQRGKPLSLYGQDTVVRMRNDGDLGRVGVNYKF